MIQNSAFNNKIIKKVSLLQVNRIKSIMVQSMWQNQYSGINTVESK